MHPALSVIFFTTASGAGYGLLTLLGLLSAIGWLPVDGWFGLSSIATALSLVTAGLLSSTAHLGHPERAWRAFSQWRSSWLSREGVASVVTYVPAGLLAVVWGGFGRPDLITVLVGLTASAMSVLTVFCTAMIYASLKPIRQWRNAWVPPLYLALSVMTGALWLNALVHLWGAPRPEIDILALAASVLGVWMKIRYWRFIDTARSASTPETATALGPLGKVRFLEAPHTEENYLLQEMGYRIARKHALKLRRITLATGFAAPFFLTVAAFATGGATATVATLASVLLAMPGILIERWLFFAEAKHTVTLYYGAASA